jgi:hypothetical protein
MSRPRNKTGIAIAALAIVVLGCALVGRFFVVTVRQTRVAGTWLEVYRVDASRRLVMGRLTENELFLINTDERLVVRPSMLGHREGKVLVWPRSSLVGVPLGDGVKGSEAESFSFDPTGVTINYQTSYGVQSVRVPLD